MNFKRQIREATGLMRRDAGSFIGRRRFLQLAGSAVTYGIVRGAEYTATETFTRTVVDPALEDGPHFATASNMPIERRAPSSPIRIAAEAWKENPSIDHVVRALQETDQDDRYTIAAPDSVGRLCIVCQGGGSRRLWGYDVIGRLMVQRPDNPALGAFFEARYRRALGVAEPLIENVVVFPGRADLPGRFRYVGFAATEGGRIIGVTEPSERLRSPASEPGPVGQEPSGRHMNDRLPASRPLSINV